MLSYKHEVMHMQNSRMKECPACGERLHIGRLICPGCRAEFPTDTPLSAYDYLTRKRVSDRVFDLPRQSEGSTGVARHFLPERKKETGRRPGIARPERERDFYQYKGESEYVSFFRGAHGQHPRVRHRQE